VAPNPGLGLGEPNPDASPGYDWSYNTYSDESDGVGQDKLLSYTTYLFDGAGQPMVHGAIYTAYEYKASYGKMSLRMSWDGRTRTQVDTEFTYARQRLQSALVDEMTWPEDTQQWPDDWVDRERFLEVYSYNVFGDRIGIMHCTYLGSPALRFPDAAGACKLNARIYDYVDGRVLVERESDNHLGDGNQPERERFISVYTWGPMGLISRRGVSVRDGYWDPNGGDDCVPGPGKYGAFVPYETNIMYDYTYMADHMGHIAALVDGTPTSPTYGTARRQVFDAFGNNIGGYITFRCASDHDWTDNPWHNGHFADPPIPPCPLPEEQWPQPTERMQTGGFNWRGSEGSITDRVAEDMPDTEENTLRWSAYTRPSTGLIYMQARYYEPETGRFTQADPKPYDMMQMAAGQNNRWNYCGNDPVNLTDPCGTVGLLAVAIIALGVLFAIGFAFGMYLASQNNGACTLSLGETLALAGLADLLSGFAGWLLGNMFVDMIAGMTLGPIVFFAIVVGYLAFTTGTSIGYLVGELIFSSASMPRDKFEYRENRDYSQPTNLELIFATRYCSRKWAFA